MIWEQLAELRKRCDVKLESYLDRQSQFGWRITIAHRDGYNPPIIVTGAQIEDVVRKGLRTAEEHQCLTPFGGQDGVISALPGSTTVHPDSPR